jgi:Immunoglobulin I-set domain
MPIMEQFPQNLTVLDGKDATVFCKAVGAPTPNVTWTYNGNFIYIIRSDYIEVYLSFCKFNGKIYASWAKIEGTFCKNLEKANEFEFQIRSLFYIFVSIFTDPKQKKNVLRDFSIFFFRERVFQIEFSMILCFIFDRYEFWNNSFSESFSKKKEEEMAMTE